MTDKQLSGNRTLTDADIEALLHAAEKRFYLNLGKGFWNIIWKVVLGALLLIALYGQYGSSLGKH